MNIYFFWNEMELFGTTLNYLEIFGINMNEKECSFGVSL